MKNIQLLNIFITACLLFSCSSSKHGRRSADVVPGTWQATPVAIDGDSKDWPSPYPNYDAKAMVAYATSNDRENLYITMQTGDELTQLKILKQGMTVWIDTGGKKDGQLKINYPLQNDNDPQDMATDDYGGKPATRGHWTKKIAKSADQATQLSLEGYGSCDGGYTITQNNKCGIKVRLRIDEYKELVWEAVVPFKAIYNKPALDASDAGKAISVCFAVKGFKDPGSKKQDNSGAGTNTNMAGGRGVGMNSRTAAAAAGPGRAPANPLQHLYDNTKTWKFFGLVYQ